MSLHDAFARLTPFELLFPDAEAAGRVVAEIAAEAEAEGVDTGDRHAFATLNTVARYLGELRGPRAAPESVHDYAALLYQAFHSARAETPLYLLAVEAARHLVSVVPRSPVVELPHTAGYLQLPQHLFWADLLGDGKPESVDGLFWTRSPGGALHLLLVTGMHGGRPGLGVVQVPEAPWDDASTWLSVEVREGAQDFAGTLPGAELEELYSLLTAGEVLKLFARFCVKVSDHAGLDRRSPPRDAPPGPIQPSGLPFIRVDVDA